MTNVSADQQVLGAQSERINEDGDVEIMSDNGIAIVLETPKEKDINQAKLVYEEKLVQKQIEEKKRKEQEEVERLKQAKIDMIRNFLSSQGSPMVPYAENVYMVCESYGDHYCKYFLAIAGVESGFGRVCVAYSAWGMVGVKFSSWPDAIQGASQWIANNYYYKGYDTFEELAYSSYGPHNPEKWIGNLYYFYNKIPF